MANDEHVALLKKGVAAWNAWRAENYDIRPDLSGANLIKANLIKARLFKANLTWARLVATDLREAFLFQADLSRANLTRADLTGANLGGAILIGADFGTIRCKLFEAMHRNALDATEFFRIPPNRVIELGGQVEI